MAEPTALARTPIPPHPPVGVVDGWEVSVRRSPAALRLADVSALCTVQVLADVDGPVADHLDVRTGSARRDGTRLTFSLAPGEWLVVDRPAAAPTIVDELGDLHDDGLVSVVDLTHGRALLRLTGGDAPATLARVCAIDLHDDTTPDGTALRTQLAAVVADLVRDDRDGAPSYLLGCEWSSARYLFDAVAHAGAPWGLDIDGFAV